MMSSLLSALYLTVLLLLLLVASLGSAAECTDSLYRYSVTEQNFSQPYQWAEVSVSVKTPCLGVHRRLLASQVQEPSVFDSSYFVPQPVYVSLTTMASRMHKVHTAIARLVQGKIRPTRIYLFLSKDPFLLDAGVEVVSDHLLSLAAAGHVTIVFTNNHGPHRKLLPALRRHWGEDCFIATVDDDLGGDPPEKGQNLLYQLLKTYVQGGGNAVVALRTHRLGLCREPPHALLRYEYWGIPDAGAFGHSEMLNLPTGTGGILYQPKFFHGVVFSKKLRDLTGSNDDFTFRFATMITHTPVRLGCPGWVHPVDSPTPCEEDEVDRVYGKVLEAEKQKRQARGDEEGQGMQGPDGQEGPGGQEGGKKQGQEGGTGESRKLNTQNPTHWVGVSYMKTQDSDTDLYNMNFGRGGNDLVMTGGLAFLHRQQLLDFAEMVKVNFQERGAQCGNVSESFEYAVVRRCSVFSCTRPDPTSYLLPPLLKTEE
jgi:hypothetical protein